MTECKIVSPGEHIAGILKALCISLEFSFASVIEISEKGELSLFSSYNVPEDYSIDFSHSLLKLIDRGKIFYLTEPSEKYEKLRDHIGSYDVKTMVFVPLKYENKLFGVSILYSNEKRGLTEEEKIILNRFAILKVSVFNTFSYFEALKRNREGSEIPFKEKDFFYPDKVLEEIGAALSIIDRDCNLLFVNKSWTDKYGSYKGKKSFDYFKGFNLKCNSCVAGNNKRGSKCSWCLLSETSTCEECRTSKAFEIGEITASEELLVKQEKTYQVIRKPFFSEGKESLVAELYIDISEQKLTDEKGCTFYSIIEQSPSIIVLTDVFGRIKYTNPKFTEITGYELKEVFGKNPRILKSGEKTSSEYKELWKTISSGEEWRGEFHNRKKNGDFYWEYASISPLKNTKGKITHYLAIKEDITERKRMIVELKKAKEGAEVANHIKSRFLANISHELRTPMNAILGLSKMLVNKSSHNLTERQIKALKMIDQSGKRLLALINNILDMAKIEAGKVEVDLEEFYLEDLITEIEYFTRGILKKNIDFEILKCEGVPVKLYSDRKKIIQILVNLISNAVKFTLEGKIEFGINKKEESIVFYVKDTGIGISEADLDIIFEDFNQVDAGHKKNYEGTGLGLAISKRIADLLNGDILVESEVDKGSIFSLAIPYFEV